MGATEILSEGTEWMDFFGLCSESVVVDMILPGGDTCRVSLFGCFR